MKFHKLNPVNSDQENVTDLSYSPPLSPLITIILMNMKYF